MRMVCFYKITMMDSYVICYYSIIHLIQLKMIHWDVWIINLS